jgi:hypothetical protein
VEGCSVGPASGDCQCAGSGSGTAADAVAAGGDGVRPCAAALGEGDGPAGNGVPREMRGGVPAGKGVPRETRGGGPAGRGVPRETAAGGGPAGKGFPRGAGVGGGPAGNGVPREDAGCGKPAGKGVPGIGVCAVIAGHGLAGGCDGTMCDGASGATMERGMKGSVRASGTSATDSGKSRGSGTAKRLVLELGTCCSSSGSASAAAGLVPKSSRARSHPGSSRRACSKSRRAPSRSPLIRNQRPASTS